MLTVVRANQRGDSFHFLHQLGPPLHETGGHVSYSYYPVLHIFMGSLPRVISRNGILAIIITDLHLPDAQCHTCCMAQRNDFVQPISITSAARMIATATAAASTAVTQAVVTTAAVANSACQHGGAGLQPYLGLR